MTPKKLGDKEIINVSVPEDANHIQITAEGEKDFLTYFKKKWIDIELPENGLTILGRGYQLTDDECRLITKKTDGGYEMYDPIMYGIDLSPYIVPTAFASFQSWLRSQGISDSDFLLVKI